MVDFQLITEIQGSQDFAKVDDESFREPFMDPSHPDVAYIVNCRTSEIAWIGGNTKELFGRPRHEFKHISDFYEMILHSDVQYFLDATVQILDFAIRNPEKLFSPHRAKVQSQFRDAAGNRISLERSSRAWQMSSDVITHTFGVYRRVSDQDFQHAASFTGEKIDFFGFDSLEAFGEIFGKREIEVLKCIALGDNSRQIAEKLFISPRTVETHRKNMLRKLEARNSSHMVYLAMSAGLL